MSCDVAVLGAGNMGTALAQVVAGNGHAVRLWSIEHDVLEEVRDKRLNTKYLEGIKLHGHISAAWDLDKTVDGARLVVVSVPSQVVGSLGRELGPLIKPGQIVLNVAKGLEAESHRRMSEVLKACVSAGAADGVGSMGGPAIAIEMARGVPMAVIVGIADDRGRTDCQAVLQNEALKVEATRDVVGLEMCATLKNVYAIALGMCDGLAYGTNTKAFLANLALGEMSAIASALGGESRTVYGLAGLGDLLTTGFSEHSRNRTLGERIGKGGDWQHFLRTHTVEGVGACRAVKDLTASHGLDTPLLGVIFEVLFEERPAPEAMRRFFHDFSYGPG
jgi:glycerol-3-phosphate dehydrogenase (NAD(P)+)